MLARHSSNDEDHPEYDALGRSVGPDEMGHCYAVGWSDEQVQELYAVEWQEPRNPQGFWNTLRQFF